MQLNQWSSKWDLASLSPACTQVEAYLRFSDTPFTTSTFENVSTSPAGVLPTVDTGDRIIGANNLTGKSAIDGLESAQQILNHLKTVKDLDASLSPKDLANVQAFTALVQTKLVPATVYFTFMDPIGYSKHTQAAYGSGLPFPMSSFLPWRWRRSVLHQYSTLNAKQVVESAREVYAALEAHIGTNKYFCAGRPTSIDALLYAHLNYHLRAPMFEEELRVSLSQHPGLCAYLRHITERHFSTPSAPPPVIAPTEEELSESHQVREAADTRRAEGWWAFVPGASLWSNNTPPKRNPKEERFKRRSQVFMAFMASSLVLYTLVSGVIQIGEFDDEDDDEDEEDEE